MKVVVFGNGFIGHNVAIAFKNYHGSEVTVVTDHPSYDLDIDMISYQQAGNLTGDIAVWATGPSTGPRECSEIGAYISKFESFLKVLRKFKLTIYISGVLGEESNINLWSPYSVMHYTCENLLELSLTNACILRVNPVYGPYQREGKLVVNAIRAKLKGEKVELTNHLARRDFIYVKDLSQDVISYALRFMSCVYDEAGVRTFNICSGELVTVETICEILGVKWVPGSHKWPFPGSYKWPYKAKEPDTGFSCKADRLTPMGYTSIAVGLKETLEWYEKNINMLGEEPRVTD